MNSLRAHIVFVFCCVANMGNVFAQQVLTLSDAIELAKKYSVDFQENKVAFIADYLSFKHYQIGFRPKISFSLNPVSYNRSYTERYDYVNNITTYRENNSLSSNGGVSLSQPIPFTGGNISVSSDISRLQNFGQASQTSFTTSPLRISVSQPLFTYNAYRWEKKEMPLKLKLAKMRLLQQEQELNQKTAELYFELVKAYQLHELALFEVQSSDTLYQAGKKLLEIHQITPLQLADLQLKQVNATLVLVQREQLLNNARFALNKHMGGHLPFDAKPINTDTLPTIEINAANVLSKAREANPFYLEIEQEKIKLEKGIDAEEKRNKFSASLNVSYGLNQAGNSMAEAYKKPTEQQAGSLSLTIPVVDYGMGKDNLLLAKLEKRTAELRIAAKIADFEQSVSRTIFDFNLTKGSIENSHLAQKLAMDVYRMKTQQYAIGLVTLRELNQGYADMLNANEKHLTTIAQYWGAYYAIQGLALIDLQQSKPLSINYGPLIEDLLEY